MNSDYVIHIVTSRGRKWSYLKEDDGWAQTGPTGRVHRLSAEQLLSHLLPPLAADQPGLGVMVKRKKQNRSCTDSADLRRLPKANRKKKSA